MDSSENLTNLKAGIAIKNVPWLDKRNYVSGEWFNKLLYIDLLGKCF